MSFGANQSTSRRTDSRLATSASDSRSFIDPLQQGYLANLFGQSAGWANPAATSQAAYRGSAATMPSLDMAMRGAAGLTDPGAQIAAQSQSLQAGLGQLFSEQINPAITSNAIAAGGLGGGRQGVAQGVAAGQLGQAYTQGLGDIVARANQTALGAATALPGIADARYRAEVQPTVAGLDPLARLSQILGAPTILQTSSSRAEDRARSSTRSQSAGFEFGLF